MIFKNIFNRAKTSDRDVEDESSLIENSRTESASNTLNVQSCAPERNPKEITPNLPATGIRHVLRNLIFNIILRLLATIFLLLILYYPVHRAISINRKINDADIEKNLVKVKQIIDEAYRSNIDELNVIYKQVELNQNFERSVEDPFEAELAKMVANVPFDSSLYELSSIEELPYKDYSKSETVEKCGNIPTNLRFDCHPEAGASESVCSSRGCCWNPVSVESKIPFCYYPDDWRTCSFISGSQMRNDFTGLLECITESPYKGDKTFLYVNATSIDSSTIRVKFHAETNYTIYEPPLPIRSDPKPFGQNVTDAKYLFSVDKTKAGFRINRNGTNTTLFDSIGKGGFIFSNQLVQISAVLPSKNIYGLGEHRSSFRLSTEWQSFTFFNKDQPPVEQANLYGSHPFYLVIEESGDCHGVLFLNSNAMDVILQPAPAITFRTIGGLIDMYFFLGPTPADVLKQYSEFVGRPFLPPYWSLGFHLCRFGYGNLKNTREVWNRTRAAEIPFDTQWNDLDYMSHNNDFTYDRDNFTELPEFIEELHSLGMHYIPLIDAGISGHNDSSYFPYIEGLRQDVFIKDSVTNEPFQGKVWNPYSTVWPDFTHPNAKTYYHMMMSRMHQEFAYDGAWIDMNEPSNFYDGHRDGCPRTDLDDPQYVPRVVGNRLATKTLCMSAKHHLGNHYDLHNTYGTSQAVVVNYALTRIRERRPFIISRSTWVGHGFYAGHWTGDVYSSWHDLKMSIPEILSFGLFQIPMVGADICGFNGNTTESLCNRWMQLGAFYPFSRNHNSDDTTEQDPVAMGDLVVRSSRKALMIRYRFLPYLYTLFFRAHVFGETVARPLFFEFIDDPNTYDIDTQFLWGSSLMIVPVLEENKTNVTAYLPRGVWYNFYTKEHYSSNGRVITLDAPLDTIPLLIRGGAILPAQTPGLTTTASRLNDFELLVALDESNAAKGELYWDDGDSLDSVEKKQYEWLGFTVQDQTLSNDRRSGVFPERMILGKVSIMGIDKSVSRVLVNGYSHVEYDYDGARSYLNVKNLQVNLSKKFVLTWEF